VLVNVISMLVVPMTIMNVIDMVSVLHSLVAVALVMRFAVVSVDLLFLMPFTVMKVIYVVFMFTCLMAISW